MNLDKQYIGIGTASQVAMSEPKQQPVSALWSAIEQIKKCASISDEVTDALCGAVPTAEGKALHSVNSSGVFGSIEEAASELAACADRLQRNFARVQSRI